MLKALLALHLLTLTYQADLRQEYARITVYHLRGIMRDGNFTHQGAAACSSNRPGSGSVDFGMGTIIEMPDGQDLTCEDTGNGDYYWKAWVDVWEPYGPSGYNDYEWVTIVRWGWGDSSGTN